MSFEYIIEKDRSVQKLTPELEESLKITQDEFKDKIQAYTAVVKQLEVDLAAIKDEKARLDSLKKSKEKTKKEKAGKDNLHIGKKVVTE